MRKGWIVSMLAVMACGLIFGSLALADWRAEAVRGAPIKVGEVYGDKLTQVKVGSLTFNAASTTTQSYTVNGVKVGDVALPFPNSSYSASAYLKHCVPSTNSLLLTWSGDPGTTVTVGYAVYRKE